MFLFQLTIFLVCYRLAPLIGCLLARYFHCQMAEPAIRCSAMPMLNLCRNVDAVARFQFDCFLALFLIISTSGYAYKNLSATALCMMDMPVVPAARLKCDIEDSNLTGGYRCQIALSDEILCKCIVWLSNWEYHFLCMRTHLDLRKADRPHQHPRLPLPD